MTDSQDQTDVEEARIVRDGRVAIATRLFAALTDWLGIAALTALIALKVLPPEPYAWGILVLAGGSAVGKALGGTGGSTTALLLALPHATKVMAVAFGRHALALALCVSLLVTGACAAALPIVTAAAAVAVEALHWIDAIDDFVAPELRRRDPQTGEQVRRAIARARAAAALLEHTARAGEAMDRGDLEAARAELERALTDLLVVTQPLGVHQAKPGVPDLLGAGGDILMVPPPEDIARLGA